MAVYPRMMTRTAIALLLCSTALAAAPVDEFLRTDQLHTVHLRVSQEQWRMMQPTRRSALATLFGLGARPTTQKSGEEGERLPPSPMGNQYAYVKATVQINEQTLADVGLRFKGNSSYGWSGGPLRKPYKLDFNRFVEGGRFLGFKALNLHNNAFDQTQLREALSYEVFRQAGVPAPRTAFALVYLTVDGLHDREFLGLYTIVEEVDKDFLKDHFGSSKGLLLKPEGAPNLRIVGEQWADHESTYRPRTTVTPEAGQRVVDFLRLIHRADDATFDREIEQYMDLDAFARFLAANVALCNLDSFLSTGHNFYLYLHPKDQKIHWLPWDLNLSFGSFSWVGTGTEQATLSITHPYTRPNRLLERLMELERFDALYRGYLRQFMGSFFTPEKLGERIDALDPIVQRADQAAQAVGKAGSPTTRPGSLQRLRIPDLKTFIADRSESLRAQLDDGAEGYIPSFRRARPTTRPTEDAGIGGGAAD